MPGRNGMGPWGRGPGTGKGFGCCGGRRMGGRWGQEASWMSKEEELNNLKLCQKDIVLKIEELEKSKV